MSNDGGGTGPKGRLVGGRYRLVERIGSGGMGTVWRAHDELVDREVAVKQPRLPGDPEDEVHQRASHRLYREARAAARVDHPAAVSIHDVVEEDGLPWIVMELVRGESLHEVIRRGPVDPVETARIGLAVLGALRAAHSVGIVHRDVKPANVLLGPHGRVVLTDFGIAHVQGEESLTMSGEFVGSIEFIAPERMSGRGAGPPSDLWSLGVLLYAAVAGTAPFRRTTLESTLAAILSYDPPEPQRAGPLGPLIAGLLAKDPDGRPDAAQAAKVLEAAAEGWSVPALTEGTDAQRADRIRESGEDPGTVRLAAPNPGPVGAPGSYATVVQAPRPSRRPHPPRRRLLAVLLVLVLAGGAWAGYAYVVAESEGPAAAYDAAPDFSATDGTGEPWTEHREPDMRAVLELPSRYEEFAREGSASDPPRIVAFEDGDIQIQLNQWDRAPGTPTAQAKRAADGWMSYGESDTQFTDTSLQGYDAVLADTTYEPGDGARTRVMELFVLTDDSRMYELRVDMPKGTSAEQQGTSLFKAARERLVIEKWAGATTRS